MNHKHRGAWVGIVGFPISFVKCPHQSHLREIKGDDHLMVI